MTYRRIVPAAAMLAALALGGCAHSGGGALNAQDATATPACRVHQNQQPSERYTAGARSDPRSVLELMRYYTANGGKAFCDGKPPTRTDQRWTDLYARLGGAGGPTPTASGSPAAVRN
ncbi:hypothetical protein [Streptomyces sp. CA-111067]|uniref:hypothetical protein n=1 Tax=Streptomyces sp. CA-111067 TaxID=3240046 RepID=UPI003D960151